MARIAPFPHRYTVQLAEGQLAAPPRAPIAAGAPPQFGGTEDVWSPEELLVAAALACLWTTFEAYARHEGLTLHSWSGSGTAMLDKGSPVPSFTSIALRAELVVAEADVGRARTLLQTAAQRCIISHALNVSVTLEPIVRAA